MFLTFFADRYTVSIVPFKNNILAASVQGLKNITELLEKYIFHISEINLVLWTMSWKFFFIDLLFKWYGESHETIEIIATFVTLILLVTIQKSKKL